MMGFFQGFLRRKKKDSEEPSRPLPEGPIVDAFREYINNEIPIRFLDTSTLQFVSRKDVFHLFQDEIEKVTEHQIEAHIRSSQQDPLVSYQPRRQTILRQIIHDIVKYVILSHRWGKEADEPTFQDVSGRKQSPSKFSKLAGFCKTAANLGCRLAWVDTCCIDDTRPAERNEAVHAMYRWYANSHACIVYLGESTSHEDMEDDSLFTRGWALQELLAPSRIKFYNKYWQPLAPSGIEDDRKFDVIKPHLERATGIPQVILTADNSQGVEGCGFWEIMSWFSKRKTTRIEDRAYCLVGLFHVSLPIAYGEGERAFYRLLEAIVAKNPSWDVFAWSGLPSVDHFSLPSSPASYPTFDADLGMDRAGIREFSITAHRLSLKSLPLISMELQSVVDPEEPGKPFLVHLKQGGEDETHLARFGDLLVECGATRLKAIQTARRLSVCIINHHAVRNREQGKLMAGKEYICFLLYTLAEGEDDGHTWMKLATDNLLRISCLGVIQTVGDLVSQRAPAHFADGQTNAVASQLVTTLIRSSTMSKL